MLSAFCMIAAAKIGKNLITQTIPTLSSEICRDLFGSVGKSTYLCGRNELIGINL